MHTQGRVTIKAETQIGHWELPEEVDARKSLFVTGDVNVGRDPSNVNVWGNVTLTGIVDLTAGADPDEALLVRAPQARWSPTPRTPLPARCPLQD